MKIVVSQAGKGDFTTIGEALEAINNRKDSTVTIFIQEGIYKEKLLLTTPFLTLEGAAPEKTLICYDDYAKKQDSKGEPLGTFGTSVLMVDANNVTLKNLTIQNTAGAGGLVGQAIALYLEGDHIEINNCRILASQDTVFTGPLPPFPLQPSGFKGPKETSPRIHGRHYFKNCYIEGDVDFIFGSSTAYFEGCELFSRNNRDREITENMVYGYVTAPSTTRESLYGYVFYRCRFTGDCPPESVYLGRPWRNFGRVVLIDCDLGEHIKSEGWSDWGKIDARDTVYFAEYGSRGKGANGFIRGERAAWSKILQKDELHLYTKNQVLCGFYKR
ncbi:MAG: Pectinesterase [Anaerocolumna sp.]|jgi:pectinesterase|nr:Pectinesterase [Anaerocolumna sp.]